MTDAQMYKKGDEKGIFKLWKNVFGNLLDKNDVFEINEKWWNWRVKGNPNGMPIIFVEKNKEKRIIAHHMIEPFKAMLEGKEKSAFLSSLTMVEEGYRGLGILNLINQSLKRAEKENALSYGFPNKNSLGIFERFGWKTAGEIPILARPLNPIFSIYDLRKTNNENYKIEEIKSFDKEIERLADRIAKKFKFLIKRDAKYLNWRYGKTAPKEYKKIIVKQGQELRGYAVFRDSKLSGMKTGIILEIFAENEDAFDALLDHIVNSFKKSKMKIISCFMIKNNFYYKRLKKKGFFKLPGFLLPKKNVLTIVSSNPELLNIKNWHISYGDWDCI